MNELLLAYSPESFHINQTHSVLIRLDGSTLRVSYTKNRIPKRAMWNEPKFEPNVIHQRMYSLEGAKLKLLPDGLARKRSVLLAEKPFFFVVDFCNFPKVGKSWVAV